MKYTTTSIILYFRVNCFVVTRKCSVAFALYSTPLFHSVLFLLWVESSQKVPCLSLVLPPLVSSRPPFPWLAHRRDAGTEAVVWCAVMLQKEWVDVAEKRTMQEYGFCVLLFVKCGYVRFSSSWGRFSSDFRRKETKWKKFFLNFHKTIRERLFLINSLLLRLCFWWRFNSLSHCSASGREISNGFLLSDVDGFAGCWLLFASWLDAGWLGVEFQKKGNGCG